MVFVQESILKTEKLLKEWLHSKRLLVQPRGQRSTSLADTQSSFPLWHKYKLTTSAVPERPGPLAVLFDNLTPAISPSPLDITSPSLRQMAVFCFHSRLFTMSEAASWVGRPRVGRMSLLLFKY